jgi:hypothetical protein
MKKPSAPNVIRLSSGRAAGGAEVLRRGTWIAPSDWAALSVPDRRRARVLAAAAELRRPAVVSHRSAAALWLLPDLEPEDHRLHVIDPARSATHSGPRIVRHHAALRAGETCMIDGVVVTSLLRTVVDIARSTSFANAVAVLDHVLANGWLALADLDSEIVSLSGRGAAIARRAVAFADPMSESAGESFSRVVCDELGAPRPVLQHEFVTRSGRFRVDFWWPDHGVIGEFDGRVKYDSGASQVLWDEKRREDALRRVHGVRAIARWTMDDLRHPEQLAETLSTAGLRLRRAIRRRVA